MVKAEDLINEKKEREKKREKIYKKIYKLAEKKIIDSNNVGNNKCYFEIPYFMLNVPLYSLIKCKEYIVNKLEKNGFSINDLDENKIIINWG